MGCFHFDLVMLMITRRHITHICHNWWWCSFSSQCPFLHSEPEILAYLGQSWLICCKFTPFLLNFYRAKLCGVVLSQNWQISGMHEEWWENAPQSELARAISSIKFIAFHTKPQARMANSHMFSFSKWMFFSVIFHNMTFLRSFGNFILCLHL